MGHQDAPDGTKTVYNRNVSVEEDPQAKEWWSDELNHRLNLRVPEWMYDDLEQHSEQQRQEVSKTARELLEYALMQVSFNSWQGMSSFGQHSYGDMKCPVCAESHGLRLRVFRSEYSGKLVRCHSCQVTGEINEFRLANHLDRDYAELWFHYAIGQDHDSPEVVLNNFGKFLEDPRSFVETVDWDDEYSDAAREINEMAGGKAAMTSEEKAYHLLEEIESEKEE